MSCGQLAVGAKEKMRVEHAELILQRPHQSITSLGLPWVGADRKGCAMEWSLCARKHQDAASAGTLACFYLLIFLHPSLISD